MWCLVASFSALVQTASGVFTSPSFKTHCDILLGWVMCIGRRTEYGVFETIQADEPVFRDQRHPFDRFYNFFNRSAWTVSRLARAVMTQMVVRLKLSGELELIVDDTLLHKSGSSVFGIGWFHDAVASNEQRDVTALGNSWVVMSLVVRIPLVDRVFCLPVNARLRQAGEAHPGPAELALEMLHEVTCWFPTHNFRLIGDGGYSSGKLLKSLHPNVHYFGLMRSDAALHSTQKPSRPPGKPGPSPRYGERLKSPKQKMKLANRSNAAKENRWTTIKATVNGEERSFQVLEFRAVWPKVLGDRSIHVVICNPLDKGYKATTLFTTDLESTPAQVIEQYAKRTSIESCFKDSKQIMQIDKPQHWSETSIKKLAPWVWLIQSVLMLWYLTEGRETEAAKEAEQRITEVWDTQWSVRHVLKIFRRIHIRQKIAAMSHNKDDLRELTKQLENYLFLAG